LKLTPHIPLQVHSSYSTVMDFLKHKAAEEHHIDGCDDCIYYFDNNQIMARSWTVQFDHKPLVSVTTVVCLKPPSRTNLQNVEAYCLVKWLGCDELGITAIATTDVHSRTKRNKYIESELKKNSPLLGNAPNPQNKIFANRFR